MRRADAVRRARASATSRDRGNDRDLVAVLQSRLRSLQEADVLLVHVEVDEAPDRAVIIDEPLLEPGELAREIVDEVIDRAWLRLDLGIATREGAKRRGDAYQHRHQGSS